MEPRLNSKDLSSSAAVLAPEFCRGLTPQRHR